MEIADGAAAADFVIGSSRTDRGPGRNRGPRTYAMACAIVKAALPSVNFINSANSA
jgi:hypothetical protein